MPVILLQCESAVSILTITLHPAIDKVLRLQRLRPNDTARATARLCFFRGSAQTPELAEVIVSAFTGEIGRVRKQAAAVLAPRHGVFVLSKDLEAAYDALERIDVNAYCVLMGHRMGWST